MMKSARSINQIPGISGLPDFRNAGTVLRAVLLANGIAFFLALASAVSPADLWQQLLYGSALLQPVLLVSLLLLYAIHPLLAGLRYAQSAAVMVGGVALVTLGLELFGREIYAMQEGGGNFDYVRHMLIAGFVCLLLLGYFRLRVLMLSPALHEARLQALHARIRPHFLFNSINAVLAIVRNDPRRAETALEDMSDLFRMAMGEPHELVPLAKEIELAQRYLALERLRLGERLRVEWRLDDLPPGALIPPLVLQPLLENAVYHGIEPLAEGGVIEVGVRRDGNALHLHVANPVVADRGNRSHGHKMALANIRERLSLLFDVEADYRVNQTAGSYDVHIRIPYLTEAA
ncbi:MAG: histidine kinase [Sideroxydans sp.]